MSNGAAGVHNPIFAHWIFPRLSALEEARGGAENRQELLAGLSGRVIEIGSGNGLNFRHYPRSVSEVVATEPERYLRSLAIETAKAATVPVRVVDGVAENLPMEAASFDAGIASLVLCSVANPARVLAELH